VTLAPDRSTSSSKSLAEISGRQLAVWEPTPTVDPNLAMLHHLSVRSAYPYGPQYMVEIRLRPDSIVPRWLESVARQAAAVAQLSPNWDTYGAPPPSVEAVLTALTILSEYMPPFGPVPDLVPTSSGGVDVDWEESWGELSISIGPGRAPSVYFSTPNGDVEWERPLADASAHVRETLSAHQRGPA
jgi:hypothetical protein